MLRLNQNLVKCFFYSFSASNQVRKFMITWKVNAIRLWHIFWIFSRFVPQKGLQFSDITPLYVIYLIIAQGIVSVEVDQKMKSKT